MSAFSAKRATEYPPEKVAEITWVPAQDIREAARLYAANKPAICISHMGIEHHANSIQAVHARFILPTITGNLGIAGGQFIFTPLPDKVIPETEVELQDKL